MHETLASIPEEKKKRKEGKGGNDNRKQKVTIEPNAKFRIEKYNI